MSEKTAKNGQTLRKYSNYNCLKFVRDMKSAGLHPYHYKGRFYWEGPAVNVGELQEALSGTKVPCQWDQMGRGYVVYPRDADPGLGEWVEEIDEDPEKLTARHDNEWEGASVEHVEDGNYLVQIRVSRKTLVANGFVPWLIDDETVESVADQLEERLGGGVDGWDERISEIAEYCEVVHWDELQWSHLPEEVRTRLTTELPVAESISESDEITIKDVKFAHSFTTDIAVKRDREWLTLKFKYEDYEVEIEVTIDEFLGITDLKKSE